MLEDLKDKTIFITGATRGIGWGIAQALAQLGAGIVFNFRKGKESAAESLEEELLKKGASQVNALKFDLTDIPQMKNAVNAFIGQGGIVHGLVNNAGISKDQLVLRLKEEDVERTLATNLKGAMFLTQALARVLTKQASPAIVNISSIIGLMGNAGQVSYAASKAGLIGLSKSLAREFASRNLRCNVICPGFIKTDMTKEFNEDELKAWTERIPLKKAGNVEDVAKLACFLLSDASSYITGEVIKIDGGLYI